jgi:GT2 family glycosyltransferase
MTPYRPWRILNVDLAQAPPELRAESGTEGIYAIFWWHDIPVGDAWLSAAQLPLSRHRVRALSLQRIAPALAAGLGFASDGHAVLASDEGSASTPSAQALASHFDRPLTRLARTAEDLETRAAPLRASVIVCTRDRPDSVARTLRSLCDALGTDDEIIVVDNAPAGDCTRRAVSACGAARYVVEPRPGLDIARNTGLRAATADLVAFCDDDVEVHPRWLMRLKTAFLDPTVQAATGLVLPASLETEAQYLFERYWGFGRGFRPRRFSDCYFRRHRSRGVPTWEIGAGASMAFRRSVFDRVGGFDERLDAGAAGCSGDSELWYRVLAAGYACRYVPAAVSFHHHRRERGALDAQLHAYMRGHVAALLVQFQRHGHLGNVRRLALSLPYYYAKLFVRHLRRGDRRRTQTLREEVLGALSGVWFYLRHRSRPREGPPVPREPHPRSDAVV